MKKECSIRFLALGIILSAVISLSAGFFAGTIKNQKSYEKDIDLLKRQNKTLLAQIEQAEMEREKEFAESLNVVEPYQYVLLEEEGYVAVYCADRKTLYASTDIQIQSLPDELQQEIQEGKPISSEEQLYGFLENYSS